MAQLSTAGREPPDGADSHVPTSEVDPAILTAVIETWRSVLGTDEVAEDDSFFDIGGTSLRAVRVSRTLAGQGLQISVVEVIQAHTPLEQSTLITRHADDTHRR